MAVEAIDNALVIQFSDSVHIAAQQMKARTRPYVQIKPMRGETLAYDGLGPVEASEIIGRQQKVNFADINHLRRKIARQRFALTLPIDAADVRGMLQDPQGEYARACVRAMERVFDRVVVASLFATVQTGRDMNTPVTAAADGVLTVDATSGLTYKKLVAVNQGFIDAEVGNDNDENFIMGIAGNEYASLMQETELTNDLYSREYAVEKGRMATAAGLKLIQFGAGANIARPILGTKTSGTVRQCFAMSERAVCVGMSKEFSIKIEPRADLIEVTQVQIIFDFGAVRTEGVLVQEVDTTVS